MLASIEFFMKLSEWAQANAKPILAGTTILFAGLWSRSCIQSNALSLELEACQKKAPIIQTVYVKQDCKQLTKVVFQPGSPCPDMTSENDNSFSIGVTQTAVGASGDKVSPLGPWTLSLGASHYADLWHPSAGVGYALPRMGGYEFGLAVDASAASFTGELGLYPQYGAKVTVRR